MIRVNAEVDRNGGVIMTNFRSGDSGKAQGFISDFEFAAVGFNDPTFTQISVGEGAPTSMPDDAMVFRIPKTTSGEGMAVRSSVLSHMAHLLLTKCSHSLVLGHDYVHASRGSYGPPL